MKKIYRYKGWYTLSEAADRLTLTLGDPTSEADVIQLAAEGHLKVCWFLRGEYCGRKVTLYCGYPPNGETHQLLRTDRSHLFSEPDYDEKGESWGETLAGIFVLPVEICPSWGWWLLTFIGLGGDSGDFCGPLVVDEDGAFWELYVPAPSQSDLLEKPPKEEVVIRAEHIEEFERQFVDRVQPQLPGLTQSPPVSASRQSRAIDAPSGQPIDQQAGLDLSTDWVLNKPERHNVLLGIIYDVLRGARDAGQPCPTARDVLDELRKNPPPEVIEVGRDEVKYSSGIEIGTASVEGIRTRIKRLTTDERTLSER